MNQQRLSFRTEPLSDREHNFWHSCEQIATKVLFDLRAVLTPEELALLKSIGALGAMDAVKQQNVMNLKTLTREILLKSPMPDCPTCGEFAKTIGRKSP